jgi:hypothetical protein
MTDIQTYTQRMKDSLKGTPFLLEMKLMSGQEITPQDVEENRKFTAVAYDHREEIPEAIRPYADLYHSLTGQEPTKRSFTDWIDTLWQWKDEKLQPDDIKQAWAQAQQPDKGFTVGRPGALTVTAVGMKSKGRPAIIGVNNAAVERTQALIEEKEKIYTPPAVPGIPEAERERMREWKAKLARERMIKK